MATEASAMWGLRPETYWKDTPEAYGDISKAYGAGLSERELQTEELFKTLEFKEDELLKKLEFSREELGEQAREFDLDLAFRQDELDTMEDLGRYRADLGYGAATSRQDPSFVEEAGGWLELTGAGVGLASGMQELFGGGSTDYSNEVMRMVFQNMQNENVDNSLDQYFDFLA